jgi:hypothetical protein
MSQRKRRAAKAKTAQVNAATTKAPPQRLSRPPREEPAVPTVLNAHAAGIDVHSDMHMVCANSAVPNLPGTDSQKSGGGSDL